MSFDHVEVCVLHCSISLVFPKADLPVVHRLTMHRSLVSVVSYISLTDADNTVTPTNIVAIYSRQLKPHEQRYPTYKKELLGMIMCLRKFHTYILGNKDVTILTDHKPLIHIMNQQQLVISTTAVA